MNDELGTMCVDWEQRIDFDRLRRQRVQKAQAAIADSDADILFVFRTEDARYLTAYRHHLGPAPVIGNATVVVGADTPPILFTMDEDHCKARMPWLGKGQVQPRANFREVAGIKEFAERLHGIMGSLSGKTIGVDIYSPSMAEGLRQAFPNSRFVDGYEILCKAKMIKTEDEIHCLKIANAMTEAAMDAALAVLKPGVRECEVLAAAWQRMTAMGSEWTQCSNIVASGPYTAPYRRFTSDRIIRFGDPVIIDIGAVFNGYYGDFTRTFICGDTKPTPEQIELHQACYDAVFRAIGAAVPGKTNADVVAACGEQYVLSSLGHGSGVNPWEPPHFSVTSKNDPLTLRPGMVANFEPYCGKPGIAGFRLEQNIVIREKGPEIYTTYPFDARLLRDVHPLDVSTGRSSRRV
ncbi:MAG TPA: Xaa-Pro peptidase family protein [Myxococcaceae bacterium]|nr:Xaa-Pro peptidase family protein [Myxococcaceae bacterium]